MWTNRRIVGDRRGSGTVTLADTKIYRHLKNDVVLQLAGLVAQKF
jgi:hypothetical protein